MESATAMVDPLDLLLEGPRPDRLRVGFAIPMSGSLGLTSPAARNCGILAVEKVNAQGGVRGRPMELVPIDAGRPPQQVAREVAELVRGGLIDAICGFQTSDVARGIMSQTSGAVPYIFTAPHEPDLQRPSMISLGGTPAEQLAPVIRHLARKRSLRRWALLGTDYVWPQAVHQIAGPLLRAAGAEIVMDLLVPFAIQDPEQIIERLARCHAQAVLVSLIGRDQAMFNRAFLTSRLRDRVIRVSGSLEESGLLEAGGDASGELYASMQWFAQDDVDSAFAAEYTARWGAVAPVVGAYAEGCYQGITLVAQLMESDRRHVDQHRPQRTCKLARADGLAFSLV